MVSIPSAYRRKSHFFRFCPTPTTNGPSRNKPPRKHAPLARSTDNTSKPRLSKLAKKHKVTAQQELEIREAFSLFCEPMEGEKEGVIPIGDVRAAMVALGIPPRDSDEFSEFISILDPEDEGFSSFEPFFAICALKFQACDDNDDDVHNAEVNEAFSLFTHSAGPPVDPSRITIGNIRAVAALLKEDVSDELLKDMLLEANGGAGVGAGVDKEQFEDVMRRAGVWR